METHSTMKHTIKKRTGKKEEKDNCCSVNSLPQRGMKQSHQENPGTGAWQGSPTLPPPEQVTSTYCRDSGHSPPNKVAVDGGYKTWLQSLIFC